MAKRDVLRATLHNVDNQDSWLYLSDTNLFPHASLQQTKKSGKKKQKVQQGPEESGTAGENSDSSSSSSSSDSSSGASSPSPKKRKEGDDLPKDNDSASATTNGVNPGSGRFISVGKESASGVMVMWTHDVGGSHRVWLSSS